MWDAIHFTGQRRARNFWGNIPGLYRQVFIAPALEKWGYTGFTLSFRDSVILSLHHSVVPSFREHFVSVQYLENGLKESDQILYTHQH